MATKGLCSTCGKDVWITKASRPHPVCQACRRNRPAMMKVPPSKRGVCAGCGTQVHKSATSADVQYCLGCRRAGQAPSNAKHGTGRRYKLGCRCDECRLHQNLRIKQWAARYKERTGHTYWTKFNTPENSGTWIGRRRRFEIYARDNFTCGICQGAVDMTLHWNDDMAASLDHIKPRSRGGDDTNENLRMAHRVCNSLRQAPELV